MKKTYHCRHATHWSSNGDDLKPREMWCNAPKTTRSWSSTYFLFPSISAQPQWRATGYLWIFRSPMKLRFQRIKNQVNRRYLQAGMAELPKVARSEIFRTACKSRNKTAITPSFGLRLRWMSTRWKGNFIKVSMEQYFCICSVKYTGENLRKRGSSNMMRTR
jgi:hypothetical protein